MSNKKSSPQAAWGIDVGSKYLKAVRLATDETQRNVRVVQSCVLPIYKTSDVENDLAAMQANVIAKFLKKHSLDGDVVVINIPSAQTLYRCFDLPAPKPKKFFEAVEYELRSRIPTDIDQLVLDFHWEELAPTDQDRTPQRRVVLVAAKKADAEKRLEKLPGQDPSQIMLQSDGVALANVTNYLLQTVDSDETIATLEIGSETSNLVIQSKNTVWFRALYHGTHAFDKIIATALKKTVRDAELLRLNLEKSPVMYQLHGMLLAEFSKIADELQRSISRYQNEFGESISQVYLCGAGSEQHGLLRFLQTGK